MMFLNELHGCLTAYLKEAEALEAAAKPWDGLFGFGSRPSDHPCHSRFVEALAEKIHGSADDLTPIEVLGAVTLVLQAAADHPEPASIHYTLIAAQGAVLELLPRLQAEDRADLLARYQAWYPRRTRLPVQKLVAKELEKTEA